ncbi:phytoene synthase [Roseibium hamelinense]|uniref:Phytoene synthase n=1 Tax=Roseibium hamelinense TaxID=150831 RepID=A0A562THT4_9HYPH|nr:phytoene/squalene synthase family protein [Roseibium hamelinense]MTI45685.1 squalene/phytoene synthase family protein [Roseibium hamelinense]TWI93132.1 phytoene synthase [Roseibium hamelinense]
MSSNFEHAADRLRELDWNRYVSALFAPEKQRSGLFALYAFNAEIARVRQMVSDPLPGEIRLQWWRDFFEGVEHGDANANPVAAALQDTIRTYNLPKQSFLALIDARVFDLYDDPMPSLNDLEGYSGETTSAVFQLASLILNGGQDPQTATIAGHAGVAYSFTGLLRSLPYHASRRQVYLPKDLLERHNVEIETVFKGETTPQLVAALGELAGHARHHLKRVRQNSREVPEHISAAYLPLALVEPYLKLMEKQSRDPLKELAELSKLRRQWTLWRASKKTIDGFLA